MRVVTARYTTASRGGLVAAKGTYRYITHRPDEDGRPGFREAFSLDTDYLEKPDAYQRLDDADGHYYYRLVLAPGEGREHGADLQAWTRDVMGELEARQGGAVSWVAVVHDDHTAHDHVHVVAVTRQRLGKADLLALRTEAGNAWDRQMELVQALREDGPAARLDRPTQALWPVEEETP